MKNGLDSNTRFLIFTFLALMLSGCTAESSPMLDSGQTSSSLETRVTPPLVAPSIENGQSSFAQNCSSCHLQNTTVSDTEAAGTNLISSDWLQQTSPTQMFTTLTAGIAGRGMPSFVLLPSGDRWNLVAYLLSLVSPQSDQSGSKLIYQNMCQTCHGSSGAGDGTQTLSKNLSLSDWQSNPLLIDYSNEELFYTIRSGNTHGMGTFAVMLSEAQLWSLVTTARALSVSSSPANVSTQIDSGLPIDKAASTQGQGFITIEGSISNGSGGKLDDLSGLNLAITRPGLETQNMVAAVGHDNTFRFVLVPYSPDWNYSAEISHNGIIYKSARFSGQSISAGATVPLTIKVYDSSTDTTALRAERLHVLLNFQSDHLIHVTESFLIRNPSSYTVLPADSQTPLLHFMLNPDATNITVDQYSQSQFLKVLSGKLGDWQPILPGGVHQVMFEYDLPFENERNFEFNTPVQVISAMIMVENQSKDITCSGMQVSNQQMAMSESLLIFSGGVIDAGDKLALHCFNKKEIFPEIIGALVLVIALLVVIWISLASRKQKAFSQGKGTKKMTLLDAIITLDDQFKAGEIPAEVYNAKREELIKKLGGE